jgi:hypothetical protein
MTPVAIRQLKVASQLISMLKILLLEKVGNTAMSNGTLLSA